MELLAYIPTLYISGLTSLIVSTVLTLFKNTITQALSLVKAPLKQNILSTTIVGNMKNNTPIPHFAPQKRLKLGLCCFVVCRFVLVAVLLQPFGDFTEQKRTAPDSSEASNFKWCRRPDSNRHVFAYGRF